MGKEGTTEHESYLLQCIRLGMLIADPTELDSVEAWHFGDPVISEVVTELKGRRRIHKDGGKMTNGPTMLSAWLVDLGCEEGINSVEDAKSAIRDRVEALGLFRKALGFLGSMLKVNVENRSYSNAELRRFAESVGKGMEPR